MNRVLYDMKRVEHIEVPCNFLSLVTRLYSYMNRVETMIGNAYDRVRYDMNRVLEPHLLIQSLKIDGYKVYCSQVSFILIYFLGNDKEYEEST